MGHKSNEQGSFVGRGSGPVGKDFFAGRKNSPEEEDGTPRQVTRSDIERTSTLYRKRATLRERKVLISSHSDEVQISLTGVNEVAIYLDLEPKGEGLRRATILASGEIKVHGSEEGSHTKRRLAEMVQRAIQKIR